MNLGQLGAWWIGHGLMRPKAGGQLRDGKPARAGQRPGKTVLLADWA